LNNLISPYLVHHAGVLFANWFGVILCAISVIAVVVSIPIDKVADHRIYLQSLELDEKNAALELQVILKDKALIQVKHEESCNPLHETSSFNNNNKDNINNNNNKDNDNNNKDNDNYSNNKDNDNYNNNKDNDSYNNKDKDNDNNNNNDDDNNNDNNNNNIDNNNNNLEKNYMNIKKNIATEEELDTTRNVKLRDALEFSKLYWLFSLCLCCFYG
jgi:hypothetical protein